MKDLIRSMIESGSNLTDVAKVLHTSKSTARRRVRELGLTINWRPRSLEKHNLRCASCSATVVRVTSQLSPSGRSFCSKSCSVKYNNLGKQKHKPKIRICNKCHEDFKSEKGHRSTLICQKCCLDISVKSELTKTLTIEEYEQSEAVKGKHPSWRSSYIRVMCRKWNSHLKHDPCRNCGYSKHIEFCHIKGISKFPKTATLGEVNHESNIIILCRNCHWELDHKLLKLSDISSRI